MKKNIKIAVSGKSGCGNTTVSKMVADILGLHFVNFTFRTLAEEHRLDLKTVLELAAEDEYWDREVDTRQVQLARREGGCVLGSRLAVWMLEEADLKVYLDASPEIRVERILKREGGNHAEAAAFTAERDRQDHDRYLHLYNIDINNYGFVDLIIDTGNFTPEEITNMIIEKAHSIRDVNV